MRRKGCGQPPLSASGILDKVARVRFGAVDAAEPPRTIFPIDQEDLYVYQLDPNDHGRYRFRDGWERMTVRHEQIPVAGEKPRNVDLPFTRHGPVIKVDGQRNLAYAVRTAWLQP